MPAGSPLTRLKHSIWHDRCVRGRTLIQKENIMGKYFIAWLLGVPAFVLVIIYLLF
jgi:hypothetical protein